MDKKGIIQEHSKIKLELYRLYLERYLSVLLATKSFDNIVVSDVFAGCGIAQNEEEGSAVVAAKTIAGVLKDHNRFGKKVSLKLNDADSKSCSALSEHLKAYDFAAVTCTDADQYIQAWSPTAGSHNLFFIDPHGYTQVSTNNLKRLFGAQNCDFLIFIPIYHIYRFLKPSDNPKSKKDEGFLPGLGVSDKKREVDGDKFYEPITKFLAGLGIEQSAANSANTVEDFADVIVAALKKISGSKFVYCQMIQNKEHNSKYALFFISHHVLGAEKFLDAQSELKAKTTEPSHQQAFDFVVPTGTDPILRLVKYDHPYDNAALYQQSIEWGLRPSELKSHLKSIEQNNKSKIEITPLPGKKRNRGGHYIDYKHFKEGDRILTVTFKR